MKRFIKTLFCLLLGTTLLTGCSSQKRFVKNNFDNMIFVFSFQLGVTNISEVSAPVNDVIDLSKEEFVDQYLDGHLEDRYDYFTYQGMDYADEYDFEFGREAISNLLNTAFDGRYLSTEQPTNVWINVRYTPTEYTIQYVGFEDQDLNPTTYTIKNGSDLPTLNTEGEHRKFVGWRIQGTDTIIKHTPYENLTNLVLEPVYDNDVFKISYKIPYGIENPNPTSYTYYDGTINLVNIPDAPNGAYKFVGFYLNDEKITSIDPHKAEDLEIECRFAFTEYTAKYFADGELVDTITFTYVTIGSIKVPNVPIKDHCDRCYWDTEVRECRDYEIHAVYDKTVFKITYEYPFEGIQNDNITKFTAYDGMVNLTPLADSDKGYYTFDGFYLDNQKITSLDTSIAKNITLVAKYNFTEYTINYYDGDTLLHSDAVNYLNFNDYVQREVPDKAHYHNKRWSEEVTELKNYNLYARYTADQYVVKVVTGIQGYIYRDTTVTYGQGITYQEFADALSYNDKYLIGLYSDASFANKINLNSVVDKDITLYAKWGNIVHLTSPSDWNEIVQNPAGRFVLENDISFKMETIPVVDNFSGILDGQGHAIQRFSNSNTGCSSNYGLFKTNTGTIKNLTIEDGTFVAGNSDGSDTCSIGVLCGTNKGTIENVDFVSVIASITPNYDVTIDYFGNAYGHCYVGLCAGKNQGTIENCFIKDDNQLTTKAKMGYYRKAGVSLSNTNKMYGHFYYGLLVGTNSGTISNITSEGTIINNKITLKEQMHGNYNALMDGDEYLTRSGGIAGNNESNGKISACVSGAEITIDYPEPDAKKPFTGSNRIGGIAGNNIGSVEKCYASDETNLVNRRNGDLEMGGIAGRQEDTGKIKACYSECQFASSSSSGDVRIGGVIGYNCGSLSYCHATVTNVEVNGSSTRGGGVGTLVGYTNDTSSIAFSIGIINISNAIGIVSCYAIGNAAKSAIINKVSINAPAQTNAVNVVGATMVDSLAKLIQAARDYYFDEVDFVIHGDKLPTIANIGKNIIA